MSISDLNSDPVIIPEEPLPEEEKLSTTQSEKKKKKSTSKKKSSARTSKRSSSKKYTDTGIPGLSVRFNWKEFLGINKLRRKFTKKTGIPTTQAGIERKIGEKITDWIKGFFTKSEE